MKTPDPSVRFALLIRDYLIEAGGRVDDEEQLRRDLLLDPIAYAMGRYGLIQMGIAEETPNGTP